MSYTIVTDIFCDVCSCWDENITLCGQRAQIKQARKRASKRGWKRLWTQDGYLLDVCPNCQNKELLDQNAELNP